MSLSDLQRTAINAMCRQPLQAQDGAYQPLLPPSEPRCHDRLCMSREACRRWLDRDGPADRHYNIMRPAYHCHDAPCPHYIPTEDTDGR